MRASSEPGASAPFLRLLNYLAVISDLDLIVDQQLFQTMATSTPEIPHHSRRLARYLAEGSLVTVHTEEEATAVQAAFAELTKEAGREAGTVKALNGRTWLLSAAVPL